MDDFRLEFSLRAYGEQADGDLRFQAAFLGESRLPEPVPLIGLEVERLC